MSSAIYHDNHPLIGKIVRMSNNCHRYWREEGYINYYLKVYKVYDFSGETVAWCHVHSRIPGKSIIRSREWEMEEGERVNVGLKSIAVVGGMTNKTFKNVLEQEW